MKSDVGAEVWLPVENSIAPSDFAVVCWHGTNSTDEANDDERRLSSHTWLLYRCSRSAPQCSCSDTVCSTKRGATISDRFGGATFPEYLLSPRFCRPFSIARSAFRYTVDMYQHNRQLRPTCRTVEASIAVRQMTDDTRKRTFGQNKPQG